MCQLSASSGMESCSQPTGRTAAGRAAGTTPRGCETAFCICVFAAAAKTESFGPKVRHVRTAGDTKPAAGKTLPFARVSTADVLTDSAFLVTLQMTVLLLRRGGSMVADQVGLVRAEPKRWINPLIHIHVVFWLRSTGRHGAGVGDRGGSGAV